MQKGDIVYVMVDSHSCNAVKEKVLMVTSAIDTQSNETYQHIWLSGGRKFSGRSMQALNRNRKHYIFKK